MSPIEMVPAQAGNLLVRDRVRKVLSLLTADEFDFYPTRFEGTSDRTPWSLVVPRYQIVTAGVASSISRCDVCDEPRSAHPGSQWIDRHLSIESPQDSLKSLNWCSSEKGWDQWIDRQLFMSVRLYALLRRIRARGLDEATCGEPTSPNREERAWVQTKLNFLNEHKIPNHAPGRLSHDDAKWFRDYLKGQDLRPADSIDWRRLEKSFGFKLPKCYKDFIDKVGACSFEEVDDSDGAIITVLSPKGMDCESVQRGQTGCGDHESDAINGIVFANSDHGDSFCFDIREDRKEFEVYRYRHDYDIFEPYAPKFAACIRRFCGGL